MLGRLYTTQDCSAARALELVGERWTLLILRDAMFRHYTRFTQFQQSLGIAPNILTKRLGDLVDSAIMATTVSTDRPDHHEYVLTEMGQSLKPVIIALTRWGDRWVDTGPAEFVHQECGTRVEQQFNCPHCDGPVEPAEVHVRRRSTEERAKGIPESES